jgi:hypothetical protein
MKDLPKFPWVTASLCMIAGFALVLFTEWGVIGVIGVVIMIVPIIDYQFKIYSKNTDED